MNLIPDRIKSEKFKKMTHKKNIGNQLPQVTDLATSRRLYESGLSESTDYEWITEPETGQWCVRDADFYDLFDGPAYCAGQLRYPAYTEPELKNLIQIPHSLTFATDSKIWHCKYTDPASEKERKFSDQTRLKIYAQLVLISLSHIV